MSQAGNHLACSRRVRPRRGAHISWLHRLVLRGGSGSSDRFSAGISGYVCLGMNNREGILPPIFEFCPLDSTLAKPQRSLAPRMGGRGVY
jgi:hypothetical protein